MGTRHLICVFCANEYKVAQYGQWDGDPSGQGLGVLNFLKSIYSNDSQTEWFDFIRKVKKCNWITNEESNEINNIKNWRSKYPELSRDTGSDILQVIKNKKTPLKLANQLDFANDSLMCEWCYVIDFDKNTFEVYKGFNKKPLGKTERFYSTSCDERGYYPVRFIASFALSNIDQLSEEEFLTKTEPSDDD
jgi:hypothetical protein